MVTVQIKRKIIILWEKFNITQKVEENPNNTYSDVCYFYTILDGPLQFVLLLFSVKLKKKQFWCFHCISKLP